MGAASPALTYRKGPVVRRLFPTRLPAQPDRRWWQRTLLINAGSCCLSRQRSAFPACPITARRARAGLGLAGTRALTVQACYGCHSNETEWPWYARIAPISWVLAYDVIEGARGAQLLRVGPARRRSRPGRAVRAQAAHRLIADGSQRRHAARHLSSGNPGARLTDEQKEARSSTPAANRRGKPASAKRLMSRSRLARIMGTTTPRLCGAWGPVGCNGPHGRWRTQ